MPVRIGAPYAALLAHPVISEVRIDDPSVDTLSDELRTALAAHWQRRISSELRVGHAFDVLARRLRESGGAPIVVQMMTLAASQERVHAEICQGMAERYRGATVGETRLEPAPSLPCFGCDDERLELAMHVAGLCCINETIAAAWLRHCVAIATAPIAVTANRAHLREEIDHARVGWAHLASTAISSVMREALSARMSALLRANVEQWMRPDNFLSEHALPEHGQPSVVDSRRVVRKAVLELVVPGFAHVGIDVGWHT